MYFLQHRCSKKDQAANTTKQPAQSPFLWDTWNMGKQNMTEQILIKDPHTNFNEKIPSKFINLDSMTTQKTWHRQNPKNEGIFWQPGSKQTAVVGQEKHLECWSSTWESFPAPFSLVLHALFGHFTVPVWAAHTKVVPDNGWWLICCTGKLGRCGRCSLYWELGLIRAKEAMWRKPIPGNDCKNATLYNDKVAKPAKSRDH